VSFVDKTFAALVDACRSLIAQALSPSLISVTPRPLEDKVIVIIGGTTGLGLSAAQACVRAGASSMGRGATAASIPRAGC